MDVGASTSSQSSKVTIIRRRWWILRCDNSRKWPSDCSNLEFLAKLCVICATCRRHCKVSSLSPSKEFSHLPMPKYFTTLCWEGIYLTRKKYYSSLYTRCGARTSLFELRATQRSLVPQEWGWEQSKGRSLTFFEQLITNSRRVNKRGAHVRRGH